MEFTKRGVSPQSQPVRKPGDQRHIPRERAKKEDVGSARPSLSPWFPQAGVASLPSAFQAQPGLQG